MNDFKMAGKQRTFTFTSPRREARAGKTTEKEQSVKQRLEDNEKVNHISASYDKLERQPTLLKSSINSSTVRKRPNKKPNQNIPSSQKLNQFIIGRSNMTDNKVKDTDMCLRRLEDLYSETEQVLGFTKEEGICFVELFRKLLEGYDAQKSRIKELLTEKAVLSMKVDDQDRRIDENSEYYKKEQAKFKNQIDQKDVENQRLDETIKKLTEEKSELFQKINELQEQLEDATKPQKGYCHECKTEMMEPVFSLNSKDDTEFQKEIGQYRTSSQVININRCHSEEFPSRNPKVRKPTKSDSETLNKSEAPSSGPPSPRDNFLSDLPQSSLSSSIELYDTDISRQETVTDIVLISSFQHNGLENLQSTKDFLCRPLSRHHNIRSNTEISSSSSYFSFANQSEYSGTGLWSRESSSLSFANSTHSE
ncbi:uncharacterized protein LOC133191549 [Saccostrea echinata]|uniref:uncharacterized protein LOC133191549 n=1 Tax=Saccostrea echinata TaxID=191078 RepID=UPI002A83F3E6|nr:uncharacterized protein LOC133191549 [Saccostrea echinata]